MKTVIDLLRELIHKFPVHFVSLFGLVLIQALLNGLSIVSIAPITDLLLDNSESDPSTITDTLVDIFGDFGLELDLLALFVVFGGLMVLVGFVGVGIQHAILRIKYDVLIHLLTDTLGQFFKARFQFFNQGDMGKLLNSFQQEVSKIGNTFGHISQLIANIIQSLLLFGVALGLAPAVTSLFVMVVFLFTLPLWFLRRFAYGLGKKNTDTANVTTGVLHEVLTGAKLFLGYGRQQSAVDRYQKALQVHADVSVKFQTLQRGVSILFVPFGMIAVLITLYIAHEGGQPLTDIAMVLFAFMRLTPLLGQTLQEKTSIEGFVPAYEQIQGLRQDAMGLAEPIGHLKFQTLKESIRFDKVTFSYPGRRPALEEVSLLIAKNKMTALAGRSGAGKTTVIDLMLGLYESNEGEVLLDHYPLHEFDLTSFRAKIGYVPQDPQLFNVSIADNLRWASPGATEQEIWRACDLANAGDFVRAMPGKLGTVVGERGVRMSGGQRQRLALARAVIRRPQVLVLDEATSALDSESERLIQTAIEELAGAMTIVIIAHRLSTLRRADYVYVLDQGKVVEEGGYDELSQRPGGILRAMSEQQNV